MEKTAMVSALGLAFLIALSGVSAAESPKVNENGTATGDITETESSGDQAAELAKQLQNPVASFIRTILPIISQDDVIPGTSQSGLGDIVQSLFFSPKKPVGGMILGFGPVFLGPSATDAFLGSEKFGAGPTGLPLKQTGGWTYGLLFNHMWSYGGDEQRDYVSATFLQPFISYTTKTTFGLNTESTYDWHNSQWTVPINLSISQLLKFGKMPGKFCPGARRFTPQVQVGHLTWACASS
jgi:hypothetical protein